jgi:hypothetical protein
VSADWVQGVSLAVQILTAFAIVMAAWQLLFHSRQMHRDFEMLYVERYWRIMDNRSTEWRNGGDLQPSDRGVVQDYLQLCEDEIDLRKLGRVTDNTWGFWANAIVAQTKSGPYAHELATSDLSLYPHLRELVTNRNSLATSATQKTITKATDPLEKNWVRRKAHGL